MTTANLHNPASSAWLTTLTACVLIGACAAARAEIPGNGAATAARSDTPAVTVSYHDLDLATTQGRTALYGRISEAAHKVCAASDIRDLKAVAATYACERDAVSRAVHEVHGTALASRG
jgi:UrcA family protein